MNHIKLTDEIAAKAIGVTMEQYRNGLARTARNIRAFTDADLKRWRKTRAEANEIAADYERRSCES